MVRGQSHESAPRRLIKNGSACNDEPAGMKS